MKTMVSVIALIVLSAVVSMQEAAAQSTAPNPNALSTSWLAQLLEIMAIWHFPTPVAPRPKQCHPFWYPTQHWGTDASGRTLTWVTYSAYYVCY